MSAPSFDGELPTEWMSKPLAAYRLGVAVYPLRAWFAACSFTAWEQDSFLSQAVHDSRDALVALVDDIPANRYVGLLNALEKVPRLREVAKELISEDCDIF